MCTSAWNLCELRDVQIIIRKRPVGGDPAIKHQIIRAIFASTPLVCVNNFSHWESERMS